MRYAILLLCFLMCGCASLNKELGKTYTYDLGATTLTNDNINQLVRNQTTKQEVIEILGTPQVRQQSSLGEIWTYTRSIVKRNAWGYIPDGSTTSSISITFDNNTVKDFNSMEIDSLMTGTIN